MGWGPVGGGGQDSSIGLLKKKAKADTHKHLSQYFTNDCTWYNHINYIKEKVWKETE